MDSGDGGGEGLDAKGKMIVALLNFGAEKRDQILSMLSCGGKGCFFFFLDFGLTSGYGPGCFGGRGGPPPRRPLSSLSLDEYLDDIIITDHPDRASQGESGRRVGRYC